MTTLGAAPRETAETRRDIAGEALLHPVALVSLATLLFNDHVLKVHAPGVLSGKLSDAAILVVGPLFLQGLWEWLHDRTHRSWRPSGRVLALSCAVTALAFVLEKLFPWATEAYRWCWGSLRWPLDVLLALLSSTAIPAWKPVAAVTDPTDLLTLPALYGAWWSHRDRSQ